MNISKLHLFKEKLGDCWDTLHDLEFAEGADWSTHEKLVLAEARRLLNRMEIKAGTQSLTEENKT